MPIGSIFSNFEYIDLTTADDIHIHFKNNYFSQIGFKLFGIPHIGLRLRARKILNNVPKKAINILDAGCGSGIYSFILAPIAKKIMAVDISEKTINYAKRMNIFTNRNHPLESVSIRGSPCSNTS